jgi:nucleotide-binding universal stress UspA family protein
LNEEFNLPSDVGCHVRIGHPAGDILEFVEENDTDLLVLGSHGRSGIRRLLMGSVAEQVIRNASCPVFTVKSFGHTLLDELPALEEVEAVPA